MNEEDATNLLISWLRQPDHGQYASYGYDIYLPNLIRIHYQNEFRQDQQALERKVRVVMPALFAAGWELCRRGILRPGVHSYNAQATADGNAGAGYSITPFGRRWLEADNRGQTTVFLHHPLLGETVVCPLFLSLAAQKVMGAYGYASEFPMERYVRDSLALPIFGGSSAIQRNNIVNWMGLPK